MPDGSDHRATELRCLPAGLPDAALDDRLAIVGTTGSGKTYAAKGFVELLLNAGARVAIVDPLGVWWGLRAAADGIAPGYPVVVFGGRHADVPIDDRMGAALGRLIAGHALACVIDLSELGSAAARRRFMSGFAEALYEANETPLHLVLDEADLWAPQRPLPDQTGLLGRIEEIVRRGRVRGFIPWLITQRPAVVHKDVLSQADILIAMKLTASQDRDAVGGWIEGQADRQEGKRILAGLPRLQRGDGYLWAPGRGVLEQVAFPRIRTFDSSRTPRRGEHVLTPRTLAEVDLSSITAALATETVEADPPNARDAHRAAMLERELAAAQARIAALEHETDALRARLHQIAVMAGTHPTPRDQNLVSIATGVASQERKPVPPSPRQVATPAASPLPRLHQPKDDDELPAAGRKLLLALAQHAPGRFTWGQVATLAGLKPRGGSFNAGRKALRDAGFVDDAGDLVAITPAGLSAAGEVPPAPSTPTERLTMWCGRLPSPAPDMLRVLAARGAQFMTADELAAILGKKPTGGHWNAGLAALRNNGLIEVNGRQLRAADLFR